MEQATSPPRHEVATRPTKLHPRPTGPPRPTTVVHPPSGTMCYHTEPINVAVFLSLPGQGARRPPAAPRSSPAYSVCALGSRVAQSSPRRECSHGRACGAAACRPIELQKPNPTWSAVPPNSCENCRSGYPTGPALRGEEFKDAKGRQRAPGAIPGLVRG